MKKKRSHPIYISVSGTVEAANAYYGDIEGDGDGGSMKMSQKPKRRVLKEKTKWAR